MPPVTLPPVLEWRQIRICAVIEKNPYDVAATVDVVDNAVQCSGATPKRPLSQGSYYLSW